MGVNNFYLSNSRLGHIFACLASWQCPLYLFPFSMGEASVGIEYYRVDIWGYFKRPELEMVK